MKKVIIAFVMGLFMGGALFVAAQTPTPGRQIAKIDKIATQVAILTNIDHAMVPYVNNIPTPVTTLVPTPPSF